MRYVWRKKESLEEFISDSQVGRDQKKNHMKKGYTVLKKTLEKPD